MSHTGLPGRRRPGATAGELRETTMALPDDEHPMIPMRLSRIVVRDNSDQQWIFLTEIEGGRGFPIVARQ